MSPKAFMYALPYELYERLGIRKYGFHGTSHSYVARRVAELLDKPESLKIITCHLGNGSSIAPSEWALRGYFHGNDSVGRSVHGDTFAAI